MDRGQNEAQRKVEFENDRVRVIRYRFAPHASLANRRATNAEFPHVLQRAL